MTETTIETDATTPFPQWPGIRRATVGDIEIAYETFGDPADPTILLVMGLDTQMIAWPDEMCRVLAAAGHHVVRFDNRDCGLSTHVDAPTPSVADVLTGRNLAYEIDDMASDAIGLLDHLGIDRCHLVGTSMGSFISQTIALRAPERVLTLSLSMTSTGSKRVGKPAMSVIRRMASEVPAADRDAALDVAVSTFTTIGSPDHVDVEEIRELAGLSWDRSSDRTGRMRQIAAIVNQRNRTSALRHLRVPTVVVHGLADPLVAASGGIAVARAIPGATFIGHNGMGHDLPRTMWRELADEILGLIERTEA